MHQVSRDSEIIFDFISHFDKSIENTSKSSPAESAQLEMFRKAIAVHQYAFFVITPDKSVVVRANVGFENPEIHLFKDIIQSYTPVDSDCSLLPLKQCGMQGVYIGSFLILDVRYIFITKVYGILSDSKRVLGEMILYSLSQYLKERMSVSNTVPYKFYHMILDNIVSGIIVINKREEIAFINHAAELILGYRFSELKDKHCNCLFQCVGSEKNWLTVTAATGALATRQKVYIVRKDGFEIAIGGSTSLLKDEQGSVIGVIGIFREFDDFQKSTNVQKDLNKMSLLAKFSSSIAHEIRNPLAGISATAQVLYSKLDENDRKKKYVSVILEEIDRINKIIKELLNFSSPSKTSLLASNINKILESCLNLIYKKTQKNHVDVIRDYNRELPDILCDENQLKQAFVNIMMNSIDAMPDGGCMRILTELIVENEESFVKIAFSDTGTGIPQEVLLELFKPFSSTKTRGLGLGLTITRNILRHHNARIKVYNLPDKGAQFDVLIPLNFKENIDEQTYLPLDDVNM